MSEYVDHNRNEEDLSISYSINIEALSTAQRPLTCCITTNGSRTLQQRMLNKLNYTKSSTCLEKTHDFRIKPLDNARQSSIHLPITYSTSIHVPCHPRLNRSHSSIISPSQSTHHHYHYYHHYYHHYHHHRHHSQQPSSPPMSSRLSRIIKHQISSQHTSTSSSTRPTTTSINTSPELLSPPKKLNKNINLSFPILTSSRLDKELSSPPPPPPLPSYSTLVWNWDHHTPAKLQSHYKGSQSDSSEIYRHERPSKRSLLLKLFTSPIEKSSKSKHHRTCFTRHHLESSSSPNKSTNYHE